MGTIWRFIGNERNRVVLSWLGAGAVVVIGGLWAAFVFFAGDKQPSAPALAPCTGAGGVTVGRDVNGSTITTNGSGSTDCGKPAGKGQGG
jgi:hypothetical protein